LASLEYAGYTFIGFEDRSYRWVTVKRFTCDPAANDETLLAALVGHWRYRDNFLSLNSHEDDTQTVHGPYWVTEISTSSFERIEPDVAAAVVEEFCGLYDSPPRPEVREQVHSVVMPSLQQSVCYRLRDLPHAIHEYGFVLMEFRELVLVNRGTAELLSVVMAID
jgi:hypothetical protein